MKTGAYSKSSNSSGFNPILQKFYEVICEIIIYKKLGGIFLIFCLSSFINNFFCEKQFFGIIKLRKLNYLETHLFKKVSSHHFEDHIYIYKLEEFSFRKFFFPGLGAFFATAKPLI